MKLTFPKGGPFLFILLVPLQIIITFLVFIAQSKVTAPESTSVKVTAITTGTNTSTVTFAHTDQTNHPFTEGDSVIIIQIKDAVAGSK